MKVFLTGATGFIGSQLVRRLFELGHSVAIVVRPESQLDTLYEVLDSINVYKYDGSHESLRLALANEMPEVVIHVASLFLAQHKPEDIANLLESNLNFPTQLLDSMAKLGIGKFINTGTSWQHYQNENYNPVNLYAATKQAFEALLQYYIQAHEFKVITLKLFDTYGPKDTRPKLFNLLRETARAGRILQMSPGQQLLDLVYIDDVLDAYVAAIDLLPNVTSPVCYLVSNPNRKSLRELVEIYSNVIGKQIDIVWGGLEYRAREVMEPCANHERVPGWSARVSLTEGIFRMEQDFGIRGLLVEAGK